MNAAGVPGTSFDGRSPFGEELPKKRPVTAAGIGTGAAHREGRGVGQGGEEIKEAPLLGPAELGTIPAREASPLSLRNSCVRNLHESLGGREVGKPDIEEVA